MKRFGIIVFVQIAKVPPSARMDAPNVKNRFFIGIL